MKQTVIEIVTCELESELSESPIFEVEGTFHGEEFRCRIEFRLGVDLEDVELDQVDYECVDGQDLGPDGFDVLEELIGAICETESYQEALEEFKNLQDDFDFFG